MLSHGKIKLEFHLTAYTNIISLQTKEPMCNAKPSSVFAKMQEKGWRDFQKKKEEKNEV